MNIFKRLRDQPRWRIITAVIIVAALAIGVTVVALLPRTSGSPIAATPAPTEAAEPTATPTPTPTPEPVALPTADVAASFDGWTQDNDSDGASTFTAEAGDAADGNIALRLESTNPAENPTRRALSQVVGVTPATTYTFSASVKNTSTIGEAPSVAVIMGAAGQGRFDFPTASTGWAQETWTYTTAADETSLPVSVLSVGPTSETRLDNISMTAKGSPDNLIINPSFEAFAAPNPQITNASLILPTGEATLGVSWRIPGASWALADETGARVAEGTVDLQPGLGVVSLQDVQAGYYSIDIVNNDNANDVIRTTLAIVAPVADGAPATDSRFGVGIHLSPAYLDSAEVTVELGYAGVRTDGRWNAVEKVPGQYNWPVDTDTLMRQYMAEGLHVLPISSYGNKLWDKGVTPSSPAGIAGYAAFTNEIATHYESDAVEIYNEFNLPVRNKSACGVTPACYMELLEPAVAAVKANHPETLIIGPATARQDDAWLTGFYQAGGLDYLDAVSFHPYDYTPESGPEFLEASVQQVNNRILEYNNGQAKPLWITELGWSTAGYSEEDQADNLVRSQAISLANGVERFYWYNLVNDGTDPAEHEGNFGILHQKSATVPAFAPKQAAVAQAVLIRKVAGKAFTARDAHENTGVYSYAFGSEESSTRVAWATTPTTVSYSATEDVTSTDQFGAITTLEPVDGRITIELDGHPLYLDGLLGDLQ
jgi:hypothetical protein